MPLSYLTPHFYTSRCHADLAAKEVGTLTQHLERFSPAEPEIVGVQPLKQSFEVTCVQRSLHFPAACDSRLLLWFYEQLTGLLVRRRGPREFINVLGFTMVFCTGDGRAAGSFDPREAHIFDDAANLEELENGIMALNLRKSGWLQLVTDSRAVVFTLPRKVLRDGSFSQTLTSRLKRHPGRFTCR